MDFSYCPVLDEMIRTQRTVGQSGRVFDQLGALSTVNNLQALRALMLERRPARTLEVGLAYAKGLGGGRAGAAHGDHEQTGPVSPHAPLPCAREQNRDSKVCGPTTRGPPATGRARRA